jgi:hypothetical protein
MPQLSQGEFDKQSRKIDDLEKEVEKLTDMLLKVKGQPIIQGYVGKKLDLNENLNVVLLIKRITDIETELAIHMSKNYLGDKIYTLT